MKKAQMNISQFHFNLFNLKIFGEIVTTNCLINELMKKLASSVIITEVVPTYRYGN